MTMAAWRWRKSDGWRAMAGVRRGDGRRAMAGERWRESGVAMAACRWQDEGTGGGEGTSGGGEGTVLAENGQKRRFPARAQG